MPCGVFLLSTFHCAMFVLAEVKVTTVVARLANDFTQGVGVKRVFPHSQVTKVANSN